MQSGQQRWIEVFEYPAGPEPPPTWEGLAEAVAFRAGASPGPAKTPVNAPSAQSEQRLTEEVRRSFEAGRARGIEEGRAAEREAQLAARRNEEKLHSTQMAGLVAQFDRERESYLHAVEHEVVELALAVAARILRREAQMDPLLLTGTVRVALGQLSQSTEVRLKVPSTELDLWTEAMGHLPNLAVKPTVVPVAEMRTGECQMETALGSVDLGVRSQLGEIERGFFDRAGRRDAGPEALAGSGGVVARETRP